MPKAVGIDLGTTNSVVSSPEAGELTVIPNAEGGRTTPSVVGFSKTGEVLVGEVAKRQAITNPDRTIRSVKRHMGTSWTVSIDDKKYRPQEISARILQKLKRDAESYLGESVSQAVITVPAYFDDAQRTATKEAGQIAGLEVLRLLNEPTAAALAYGLDKRSQGTFAVYDLGGGTFDISILKLVEGVFEVKAVGGDSALGGDDFDRAIAERLLVEMGRTRDPRLVRQAIDAAKAAKESLTRTDRVEVEIDGWTRMLTRAQMEELIRPLVERTGPSTRRALKDAGVPAGKGPYGVT